MDSDRQRFCRLIEPIHDDAASFARCLCRSRADGDDLFQEALVRALAKIGGLRDDAAFKRWLYRVIVSVHRNRSRRAFWSRLLPLTVDVRDPDPSPDHAIGGAERARAALAELPPEQRETIVLFEIEGWQVTEIAELHGVSASAVKSRLTRGRERLRAIYGARFAIGPEAASLIPGGSP
jgi:RNA polymerase sigma-70 factor (ECF subfamily)